MREDRFWEILDMARRRSGETSATSQSARPEALLHVLTNLSDTEVGEFGKTFYRLLCELNDWGLWAAGYILAGGMSDDSFHYFRSWIIGKGKEAFEIARTNPAGLDQFVGESEPDMFDNELLEYVAVEILEERGQDDPRDNGDVSPDDEPRGEPFDEDNVENLYPTLVAVSKRLGNWS